MVKFFSNYLPQVCNFWYTSFLNKWKQSTYTVWPKLSTTWLVSIISFLTMNLFQISLLFSLPVGVVLRGLPAHGWSVTFTVWRKRCISRTMMEWLTLKWSATFLHRHARFDWSHDHLGWTIRTWRRVHWSDESRFLLRPTDGRARVWHQRNTSFQDNHILGVGV
jgi:hypothetical protein